MLRRRRRRQFAMPELTSAIAKPEQF
jgi:hypothetical protein